MKSLAYLAVDFLTACKKMSFLVLLKTRIKVMKIYAFKCGFLIGLLMLGFDQLTLVAFVTVVLSLVI